jgi:hypothetical protein
MSGGNLAFVSSGVVEAEGIVPVRNISVDDLPSPVIIPALSRVLLTDGNTIDDINASAILINSWNAGYIRLFLNGDLVDSFPPIITSTATTLQETQATQAAAAQAAETVPGPAVTSGVAEALGLVAFRSITVDDIPATVIIPALSRVTLTVGNSIDDVNASVILRESWRSGYIALFVDGVPVTTFPPLSISQPTFAAAASPAQTGVLPTGVVPGTYTNATITVGEDGRITFAADGLIPTTLDGDVVGPLDANQLATIGVVPGIYTNATITVDAKGRVIAAVSGVPDGGGTGDFATPAGVIDGVNDTFTLTQAPEAPSDLILTKNGIVQKPGVGNDYTIAAVTITFEPGNIPLLGDILLATYQVDESPLTATEHERLRQLIHLADSTGPTYGFASGLYREINPPASIFPTVITWWNDVTMVKRVIEKTVTYTGILPTTIQWDAYDVDGVTIVETAIDSIVYSGVFETNRTRTFV